MLFASSSRLEQKLWWDKNWGILEGCTPVSPACKNCFAKDFVNRFGSTVPHLDGLLTTEGEWTGEIRFIEKKLSLPLNTHKPTVWFVTERSDIFHEAVPEEYINRVFGVMEKANHHTFLVLTKRTPRMKNYLSRRWALTQPPSHIIIGTTIENQALADFRLPSLLQTPAAGKFVSAEPLLSKVDMNWALTKDISKRSAGLVTRGHFARLANIKGINWVIGGGESGPNARICDPAWARALRDQCVKNGVPFFWKQWGEWLPASQVTEHDQFERFKKVEIREEKSKANDQLNGIEVFGRVGKKKAGYLIDGQHWCQLPTQPSVDLFAKVG